MKLAYVLLIACLAGISAAAQNTQDIVTEKATPVQAWSATLVELHRCRPDSDVCDTDLYVETGRNDRRLVASHVTGPFVLLVKSRRVFACESNAIVKTRGPKLLSLNGDEAALAAHPGYLRNCTVAGSGEEVLLLYSLLDEGKPFNLVRIFDSSGDTIFEKRLEVAGELEFTVSGRRFRTRVPAPEFPG